MPKEFSPVSDWAYNAAKQLVAEWDLNNNICLLDDHRTDLVFSIARIIDAQPRLLEAARFALSVIENLPPTEMSETVAVEKLTAALALAEPAAKGIDHETPTNQS